jgi:hypothetical protein
MEILEECVLGELVRGSCLDMVSRPPMLRGNCVATPITIGQLLLTTCMFLAFCQHRHPARMSALANMSGRFWPSSWVLYHNLPTECDNPERKRIIYSAAPLN